MTIAAGLLDVLDAVVGVLLALTGLALGFMGVAAVGEGVVRRGLLGFLAGGTLLAIGLWLTGFL